MRKERRRRVNRLDAIETGLSRHNQPKLEIVPPRTHLPTTKHDDPIVDDDSQAWDFKDL